MEAISGVWKFISYWWFRWSLVTEMYMVEKWERITITFWYFNYKVFLSFTTHLTSSLIWGDPGKSSQAVNGNL